MTTTPVKLDENLGRVHIGFLRQMGYSADRVVYEQSLDTLKGCLVVADETNTRIRRPPIPEKPTEELKPS